MRSVAIETLHDRVIDSLALPGSAFGRLVDGLSYMFPHLSKYAEERDSPGAFAEAMNDAGIDIVAISIQEDADLSWAEAFRDEIGPERCRFLLNVDPRRGPGEMERIDRYLDVLDIRGIRMGPWKVQEPPTHRLYWPFYFKAIESGIHVQLNVGMPGPKYPGWVQHPLHVDEVCFELPDLRIAMTHVGMPWVDTTISVLARWDNCYLIANSVAPKYWPDSLVAFIKGRGIDKVVFGTEYPLIPWRRALEEISSLALGEQALAHLLTRNAAALLRSPAGTE